MITCTCYLKDPFCTTVSNKMFLISDLFQNLSMYFIVCIVLYCKQSETFNNNVIMPSEIMDLWILVCLLVHVVALLLISLYLQAARYYPRVHGTVHQFVSVNSGVTWGYINRDTNHLIYIVCSCWYLVFGWCLDCQVPTSEGRVTLNILKLMFTNVINQQVPISHETRYLFW